MAANSAAQIVPFPREKGIVMIAYISIGNSDDKLTQQEWSQFVVEMSARVVSIGQVHGAWFSVPHSPYQNACWCVQFDNAAQVAEAREVTTEIRTKFRQESIAWAVAQTEFI
jgi:hypothetical protein